MSPERMPEPREEAALLRTIRTEGASTVGRKAADELLRPYQRRVYLWCFRYVADHERALDLAQDVFLRALRGLAHFEGRSNFSLWLFAITRNRCLTAVQKPEPIVDTEVDLALLGHDHSGPDQQLEDREGEQALLELIERSLDPIERRAIWMRCIERMSVEAITEILEIHDRSGARGVLQRARRKLRAAMDTRRHGEETS